MIRWLWGLIMPASHREQARMEESVQLRQDGQQVADDARDVARQLREFRHAQIVLVADRRRQNIGHQPDRRAR